MIITNYFIKKKLNSLAGVTPRRACYYRSFQDVRHILVFYDGRDREPVARYMEKLRKLQKEVRGCVLVSSASEGAVPEASDEAAASDRGAAATQIPASGRTLADYPVSLSKSLNIWGFPSEATRRAVDALPADLLIDLTRRHCYAMHYLVLRHPCRFKVGPKREGLDVYDLSILAADREGTAYLCDQILFYLQAIRSL